MKFRFIYLITKTGFSGLSVLGTSLKCSVHRACTSSHLLRRFPFYFYFRFSLHNILVSPFCVFMCWFLAASFTSQVMSSIHFYLSVFILLFTSLLFSTYFALSCFLTLSDRNPRIFLLISSLWSLRLHTFHGFFFFFFFFFFFRGLPKTDSQYISSSIYAFFVT